MQVEKIVDYIAYSTDKTELTLDNNWDYIASPNRFYKTCREYTCGTRIFEGNPNSGKQYIVLSGVACERRRDTLADELAVEIEHGATVSRIDLCVTMEGIEPMRQFEHHLSKGQVVTDAFRLDDAKMISDRFSDVQTLYVGDMKKRAKKGIFRAYNKGIESGLGIDLSRFELECKRKKAHTMSKRWLRGTDIGAMIRSVIDCPKSDLWIQGMGEKETMTRFTKEDATPKQDAQEKTWAWLVSQVAPALGRAIADDEIGKYKGANFELFNQHVARHYNTQRRKNGIE